MTGAAFEPVLQQAAVEVEAHVALGGWDQRPALFALVRAGRFVDDDPEGAARLGLTDSPAEALTPVEQEPLPDGELDEILARIAWPESVAGCVLSQEILVLPPSAEGEVDDAAAVAAHPDRREARLVVAVLREGASAVVVRLRAVDGTDDDLLTGPDLAPNLVEALLTTLRS